MALRAGPGPQTGRAAQRRTIQGPGAAGRAGAGAAQTRRSDDGDRQMVAILAAVLTDGLPAVEAACTQAMSEGVHSSDVIINILGRHRDPGPAASIRHCHVNFVWAALGQGWSRRGNQAVCRAEVTCCQVLKASDRIAR